LTINHKRINGELKKTREELEDERSRHSSLKVSHGHLTTDLEHKHMEHSTLLGKHNTME
jgi:hypothetical protein